MCGYKPRHPRACLVAEPQSGSDRQEGNPVRHKLKVHTSPDGDEPGRVVGLNHIRLPRRLHKRIFGGGTRVAVLLPGVTVDEVTIIEHDDLTDLADAVGVLGGDSK